MLSGTSAAYLPFKYGIFLPLNLTDFSLLQVFCCSHVYKSQSSWHLYAPGAFGYISGWCRFPANVWQNYVEVCVASRPFGYCISSPHGPESYGYWSVNIAHDRAPQKDKPEVCTPYNSSEVVRVSRAKVPRSDLWHPWLPVSTCACFESQYPRFSGSVPPISANQPNKWSSILLCALCSVLPSK